MLSSPYVLALLAAVLVSFTNVAAVAPTDEYSDADPAQSGYLPNHNMDPAVVDSSEFGQLWKVAFNTREQFYAKPLTYTPLAGGPQLLFLASTQNWIRTLDAKTGNIINTRQVHTPFLQSDIGCTDIANTIGIVGTPVIDPGSDIAYFFSKTYIPNYRTAGNTGTYNGVYYFHGVNVNTLQDVPGYPILADGSTSDNAPSKYFIGGTVLQRPSLAKIGNVVYGAFGGHCDLFNYTGLVIGIDVNQKKIVTSFATETGPLVPQSNVWNQNGGGGQGGIWMSGMSLSTDGARLFFVSGNGVGHQNSGTPASGSTPLNTLGEACVNLQIGAGGVLSLTDYFQPYDYENLDGGDQDLGSGGMALLDPGTFKGTGVSRIGVTAGKNGKIYILNADNLGGYRLGPGQTDGIIQTLVTNKAVFGGSGSYPLEGGYIYSTPVGYPTYVYKLGFTGAGVPQFNPAGQSRENSAGRVGVGIPTITTYQGKAGTGILWMTDPDAGLRAWYAVPGADGFLKTINLPQVNGLNKFQRPAFGDGRLYVSDPNGVLYCLGSPVNLPVSCTSPVSFGTVALGSQSTQTVTCKANIAITSVNGATVGDAHFEVNNSSLPRGPVAAGTSFSFPVTWNLQQASVSNAPNASFGSTTPGVKSTALTLFTTNAVTGYSTQFPISLTGTQVSQNAFLSLTPITVDYGGVVILPNQPTRTISLPFVIANSGSSPMTILGYAYTTDELDNANIQFTNTTFGGDGTAVLGHGFTSSNLPAINTVIQANEQVSVSSTFTPVDGIGQYLSYFNVWTNGGKAFTILEGSASAAPVANFSISTSEGGWLPPSNLLMDFGKVAPGSSSSRQIRICSVGGSVLEISKSKPPNGVIRASAPGLDLHESQQITVGSCAYGTVLFIAPTADPNVPDQVVTNTWTLNTNDLNFGVHEVQITGTVVSVKVGPTNSTGNPVYTYLGCFQDGVAGKLLPALQYSDANNNNGRCQTGCEAGKYIFTGTEYQNECYCGNRPPPTQYLNADNTMCTFACSGDGSQHCGGVGGFISVYYDATRYTPGTSSTTTPPNTGPGTTPGDPVTVSQVANYNYIGCYSEAIAGRALSGKAVTAPATGVTVESCQAACSTFTYFGVEYSNECYCGNTVNPGSIAQTSTTPATNGCSMLCGGNQTEYCGGANRLNMYSVNSSLPVPTTSAGGPTSTPTGPVVVQTVEQFAFQGCYSEATGQRALTGLASADDSMTIELCATTCASFTWFGTEYGRECYCGLSPNIGSAPVANQADCNMVCPGNGTEYCGAGNLLQMYKLSPPTANILLANSNISSNTSTSIFSASIITPSSSSTATSLETSTTDSSSLVTNSSTVSSSITITTDASTTTSSGSSTIGSSSSSSSSSASASASASASSSGSPSGSSVLTYSSPGSSASSAYSESSSVGISLSETFSSAPVSSSASSNASSPITTLATSTTSTTSFTTLVPTPGQTIGTWVYLGCANQTVPHALSGASYTNTTGMTVEACQQFCSNENNNYGLAGVENATQCYCGNALQSYSALGFAGCSKPCPGNSSEICGGSSRLSVYNSTAYIPPTTVKQVDSYVSKGCYADATTGRLLNGSSYSNSTGMTVETCVSFCVNAGSVHAGLEDGKQCLCGSSLPSNATALEASQCNVLCTGNGREFCGAAGKLNVYFDDPTSLNPDGTPRNMNTPNSATVEAVPASTFAA